MMTLFVKHYRVALLLVGSAILLSACEKREEPEHEVSVEKLMTEYSENRTIIATENGEKQYQFFAPLLEGYTAGDEPYREFRRGIRMITFLKDSTGGVDVTLTANYAIYYEKRKLWEAKGDVVVRKFDGKELYTEQLFWNDVTNKIYSNVDTKIVEPDGETYVSGFESDEEFRFWSAREMDGRRQMEFTPTAPDSTALEEPEMKTGQKAPVKRPDKDSPEADRRREEARKRAAEQRATREKGRSTAKPGPKRPESRLQNPPVPLSSGSTPNQLKRSTGASQQPLVSPTQKSQPRIEETKLKQGTALRKQ